MNETLYEKYGKTFLYEFNKFASDSIFLYVVFEGNFPSNIIELKKNIILSKFNTPEQKKFIHYFGKLEEAKGLRVEITNTIDNKKRINFGFDYRLNAIRFSFKPYSIFQILNENFDRFDFLIWTDADLRCLKTFNEKDLLKFLPENNQLMSYLGRKYKHSECGFIGFNLKHPKINDYVNRVIEIYTSGEIFSLEQWHDSWIWDYVRKDFENNHGISFKNISGDGYEHHHPFIKSGLEEFFDHLKGPERKKIGRSNKPSDIKLKNR